jgi:GT2 family glycosyltransferase
LSSSSPSEGADVTSIIVSHNNADMIARCLQAVEAAVDRHRQQILVVDNASHDGTAEAAMQAAPAARVIPLAANIGFARANNVAIAEARGRYIALVNSDAFPDAGAIDRLIECADANPRIELLGGLLRSPDGRPQPSAGRFPSLLGDLWVALFLHRVPPFSRLGIGLLADPSLYRAARPVDWVSGAFCLARRTLGPLPTAAFMYGEDVEWSFRARQRNREVWVEPRAGAIHLFSASADASQARGFRLAGHVEYELRWFAPRGRLAVAGARAVMAVHAVVRLLGYAIVYPIRPAMSRRKLGEFARFLHDALRAPAPSQPAARRAPQRDVA